MATYNTLAAAAGERNTGLDLSGLLDPSNIKGGFFCPPNYVIPAASFPNGGLLTQFKNDAMNDSKSLRIYPFANLSDFKDASEKPVEEKQGYGDVGTVRDGIYDHQFRFRRGGLLLSNKFRSRNRQGDYFMFVDNNNLLVGTAGVDSTGAPSIAAIPPIEFYQDVFVLNDGKKNAEYWMKFRYQPTFINELIGYSQDVEFNILSTILGLQDITLTMTADATKGVYHVTALAGAAKANMATLFPTALASASLWNFINAVTGAAITISSVALGTGANAGSFTITVSTTAPPYPAGATKVAANTVGPTELATGLVPNYESLGAASCNAN